MFSIRRFDTKTDKNDLAVHLSRNRTVAELRQYIKDEWDIPLEDQKLYYQGKELVDEHKIIEYKIQRNTVVQLMIRPKVLTEKSDNTNNCKENSNSLNDSKDNQDPKTTKETPDSNKHNIENLVPGESKYYKIGDVVDLRMEPEASWFESKIVNILQEPDSSSVDDEDNLIFFCSVFRFNYMKPQEAKFKNIRPVSYHKYNIDEITEGTILLANVNIENVKQRGLWYDVEIKKISKKQIEGIAFISQNTPVECTIYLVNELMRIEQPTLLSERKEDLVQPPLRKYPVNCTSCNDNERRGCRHCGCRICAKKELPELLLLCDECDLAFHIHCLDPPLEKLPADDEWFCPSCKNDKDEIVKAGEKLKNSKRSKMPSSKNTSTREWDNGMACAGRTKECTIVPKNHFGHVPGVDVGSIWKYRAQVSEAGIHRPIVAGIHGRAGEGAYSIVVSGGYEDDVDNGEEFEYTGAGGRDLSGNKRVSDQTRDQQLQDTNKALAMNCAAKFNDKDGAEATDWRKGKPVRVVRKSGASKYAPSDGYRYDGIYKIVKYYPEKGKSGFLVWKYLLRRDDESIAPWDEKAPVFEIIYPPDHFELEAEKKKKREQLKAEKSQKNNKSTSPSKTKSEKNKKQKTETTNGVKRKQPTLFEMSGIAKKAKVEDKFTLSEECKKLIEEDVDNEQHWKECFEKLNVGKKEFLDKVLEVFMCICCQELVNAPVILTCKHHVCKECLQRSFKAEIYTCPNCRHELGKNYNMKVNTTLYNVLKTLLPGYENGR